MKTFILHRENIFFTLVLLVFIAFPISYAISSISIFLFIPFFFLDSKNRIKEKWKTIKSSRIVILYGLFFLTQVVGIFYSENLNIATTRIKVMLPMLFLPAILLSEQLSESAYNKLLKWLKYIIPSVFIFYLLVHVFIDERTVNTFVHFTIKEKLKVSQFYLMFLILVPILETILQIDKKNKISLNVILLLVNIGILLLLGNKTSLVFLTLITAALFIKTLKRSKKNAVLLLAVVVVFGCLGSQLPIVGNKVSVFFKTTDFNMETILTKNRFTHTKNTFEHRVLIDYLAMKEIRNSFPFGVGTGDFQESLNTQYKKVRFKAGIEEGFNNHNQYLAEFLKTGLLGGVFFILLIITLLKKATKEQFFYSYLIIFFALGCLVESYLDRQHGVIIFAFMIPLFLKMEKLKCIKNESAIWCVK